MGETTRFFTVYEDLLYHRQNQLSKIFNRFVLRRINEDILDVLPVNPWDGSFASLSIKVIHHEIRLEEEVAESIIAPVTKIQFEHMLIQIAFVIRIPFPKNGIVWNKITRLATIFIYKQLISIHLTCFK